MTQLLLDDKCGITLSDEEQTVLIEVMACSVRRASGATPPPGRAKGKVCAHMIIVRLYLLNLYG